MPLGGKHPFKALFLITTFVTTLTLAMVHTQRSSFWTFCTQIEAESEVSYDLLWKLEDTHTGWINLRVSVEDYLNLEKLKRLICSVVRRERPHGFKYIRVFVYHSATEFSKKYGVEKDLVDRTIATYFWNRGRVGREDTWQIMVNLDAEGRPYKYEERPRLRFNHETDCQE